MYSDGYNYFCSYPIEVTFLQDVLDNNSAFGGITVLFCGDFHQTTPIVPRGSREKIVNASLKRSSLWNSIEVYHLKQNMQLDRTPESDSFAAWLWKLMQVMVQIITT